MKLLSELFGGQKIESGKPIWDPSKKEDKIWRVLIMGKGMVGSPAQMKKKLDADEGENEFDVDRSDARGN